jgi:hypothetical protein
MTPEMKSSASSQQQNRRLLTEKNQISKPLILNTIGVTIITKLLMFSMIKKGEQPWLSQKL